MLDTDLLPIPSFRPDGRLERLNSGGGGKKMNVDGWVNDMRAYRAATGKNPAEGGKKGYAAFHNWQQGGGSSGSSVATANAKPQQQQQAAAPVAASDEAPQYTDGKKKRRTLLSGQQSLSQPYGNSTILGA